MGIFPDLAACPRLRGLPSSCEPSREESSPLGSDSELEPAAFEDLKIGKLPNERELREELPAASLEGTENWKLRRGALGVDWTYKITNIRIRSSKVGVLDCSRRV